MNIDIFGWRSEVDWKCLSNYIMTNALGSGSKVDNYHNCINKASISDRITLRNLMKSILSTVDSDVIFLRERSDPIKYRLCISPAQSVN